MRITLVADRRWPFHAKEKSPLAVSFKVIIGQSNSRFFLSIIKILYFLIPLLLALDGSPIKLSAGKSGSGLH